MSECKYLKVTIGDNDFTGVARIIGQSLIDVFKSAHNQPTEDDLPQIRSYITSLWWSLYNLEDFYRWKGTSIDFSECNIYYFERSLKLEIVNYEDIPDWDNGESFYVPLSGSDYESTIVR